MADNAMYKPTVQRTYNVPGAGTYTQSQLNNNMSGTDANAIYYATHGGNSGAYIDSGNTKTSNVNVPISNKPTGGGGSGSGSANASSSFDMNAYLAELYAQRQAAAEDAYNKAMSRLGDAYDRAAGNYANVYNSGVGTLGKTYDNSRNKINDQATDAMRQAYINRMLSEKNLSQKLAAQGLSGGASESAMAGLLNNYGNARNNIQKTWNTNLSDLELGYNTNLADLYNAYQERMAALDQSRAAQEAQLLSNLNNQIASVQSDYFKYLASDPASIQNAVKAASQNIEGIQPIAQEVTNPYVAVNTQQGNDVGGTLTNYSMLQALQDSNNGAYDAIQKFLQAKYTPEEIASMMLYGK